MENKNELEIQILKTVKSSIGDVVSKSLTGYNSPLEKLTTEIVNENRSELYALINEIFRDVIRADEFKQSVKTAFVEKLSRAILSGQQSVIDRVSNELKQDKVFNSKITIAVNNIVEEFQNKGTI